MNILKKISLITSVIGIMAAILMPAFVTAQTAVKPGTSEFGAPVNSTYTLLEPLPCIAGTGNNCTPGSMSTTTNIQTYIVYVFKLMIALAVLAAVVMCIIGGFEWMLTDSVNKKIDAKKTIQNAILGLAGALGSYLILYAINPNLVNVSLVTVPKLNVATTSIDLSPTDITPVAALDTANTALGSSSNQIVQQNNAAIRNTQAQLNAAQTQAGFLAEQLSDNNCDPSDTTPPCSTLEEQYETVQDQITLYTSQAATQSAIGSMNNAAFGFLQTDTDQAASGVGNSNITAAQAALTSIDGIYSQTYSEIDNSDIADKQLLTNQKTYQEASVIQNYQTSQVVQNLLTDEGAEEAGHSENVAAAQAEINSLQANQIPKQLNGTPVAGIGNLNNNPTLSAQYTSDNQARIQKILAVCSSCTTTSKPSQ